MDAFIIYILSQFSSIIRIHINTLSTVLIDVWGHLLFITLYCQVGIPSLIWTDYVAIKEISGISSVGYKESTAMRTTDVYYASY